MDIQDDSRRQAELESIRLFGRHVSREKGAVLLAVTLAVCALPMLLGLRQWDSIPEMVSTGLIGPDGRDDSLPRAAVVFVLPGLMCLLNLITHVRLLVSQRRMTLPKPYIRLMGRWGFPVLSLFFCGGVILYSAGGGFSPTFLALCALGLGLMVLGSHLWERRFVRVLLLAAGFLAAAGGILADGG